MIFVAMMNECKCVAIVLVVSIDSGRHSLKVFYVSAAENYQTHEHSNETKFICALIVFL
jgi:hypothetical protein